ncbi:MAG: hypothetical protein H8Z69_01420 [Nanohaloarchaea archaeon]|nr:hypothetical protein [Candidatus Nanohaloarchaea archaeon]
MEKKILVTIAAISILAAPVAADFQTNYSSSYSYSTSSNDPNQSWSFQIQKIGASCSNSSKTLRNVKFHEEGVSFEGALEVPTPCRMLEADIEQTGNRTFALKIDSEPTKMPCTQCVGQINYKLSFNSSQPYKLRPYHKGKVVETFEHPDFDNESREFNQTSITPLNQTSLDDQTNAVEEIDADNTERRMSVFEGFLNWFGGLF